MLWNEAIDSAFSTNEATTIKRILSVRPQKANVIVCFCGLPRNVDVMVKLWKKKFAPKIDCIGNNSYPCRRNPNQDAHDYAKMCESNGVSKSVLFSANTLTNTKEAAEFEAKRMLQNGWTTVLFVAQGYHLPRAFATFIKILINMKLDKTIKITPQPLMRKDWSVKDRDLQNSWIDELKTQELPRIAKYQEKGDVVSWSQVKEYLDFWKLA